MKTHSYRLIDSGNFMKLEQIGPYLLARPAAQAVWQTTLSEKEWEKADYTFIRDQGSQGVWKKKNPNAPDSWILSQRDGLKNQIKLTDFGHLGVFFEHHELPLNIPSQDFKLLNLFAYTGAISIKAAALGAQVTHVDASKSSVEWAKANLQLNPEINPSKIRFILEDVRKFIAREIRRGSTYHGIILDPPTFGRGSKGELWKIETDLYPLLTDLHKLLAKDFSFIQLSCHSPGFTPLALQNLLKDMLGENKTKGKFSSFEMTIPHYQSEKILPSGACCIYEAH